MITLLSFLSAMLIGIPTYAVVDTATGAFSQSWIDFEGQGLDLNLKLERTYNSRSNHNGWFGHGWCTDLETDLKAYEKSVVITHCGAGFATTYLKKGTGFVTKNPADGVIHKEGSVYLRGFKDGTIEKYSSDGRLIEITKNKDSIYITYDGSVPKEIADGGGRKVIISHGGQNHISKIVFKSKNKDGSPYLQDVAEYTYKNDDLTKAVNFWKNIYSYEYDTGHNLTKALWPNGKSISMTYNPNNDWVLSVKGTDICSEKYDYKVDNSKMPVRYSVTINKACKNSTIFEKTFSYSFSADNSRLVAMELSEDGVRKEFKYDDNGNVIEVIEHRLRGSVVTKISRNDKGQVISVASPTEARLYEYQTTSSGKDVVSATTYQTMVDGKVYSKDRYTFSYDEHAQLVGARKPDGTNVLFKRDADGRLQNVVANGVSVEVVYDSASDEVKGVKLGQKVLSLEIYTVKATPQEIAAVELYIDFIRMSDLAIPTY